MTTSQSPRRPRRKPRAPGGAHPSSPRSEARFANRELSWLDFNARVLAEAADVENPLLERVKFLAIFESNLDEFVMKRVGGLQQQVASQVRKLSPDGMSPGRQLEEIRQASAPGLATARRLLRTELLPALGERGIRVALAWEEVSAEDRDWLTRFFDERVFPSLPGQRPRQTK